MWGDFVTFKLYKILDSRKVYYFVLGIINIVTIGALK